MPNVSPIGCLNAPETIPIGLGFPSSSSLPCLRTKNPGQFRVFPAPLQPRGRPRGARCMATAKYFIFNVPADTSTSSASSYFTRLHSWQFDRSQSSAILRPNSSTSLLALSLRGGSAAVLPSWAVSSNHIIRGLPRPTSASDLSSEDPFVSPDLTHDGHPASPSVFP